jgi:hypothetical protein
LAAMLGLVRRELGSCLPATALVQESPQQPIASNSPPFNAFVALLRCLYKRFECEGRTI